MATYDVPIASETTSQEIKTDVTAIKSTTTNTKAGVDMLLNAVQGSTVTDPSASRGHIINIDFTKALPRASRREKIGLTCEFVSDTGALLGSSNAHFGAGDQSLMHQVMISAPYSVRFATLNIYLTYYGLLNDESTRYVNYKDEQANNRVLLSIYQLDLTNVTCNVDVTRLITRSADAVDTNALIDREQEMFSFRECDEAVYKLLLDLWQADVIDIRDFWEIGNQRYYTTGNPCNPAGSIDSSYEDSFVFTILDYKLPSNIHTINKYNKNELLIGISQYKNPNGGLYLELPFDNTNGRACYYTSTLATNIHTTLNSKALYHEYYVGSATQSLMMDYVSRLRIKMLKYMTVSGVTDWYLYEGSATNANRAYIVPTLPNIVGKIGMGKIDDFGGEQVEYFKHGLNFKILNASAPIVHTQSPVLDLDDVHYAVKLDSVNPSTLYPTAMASNIQMVAYNTDLQTLVFAVAD